MKALALKKILPALLITVVLFTGFFGVVGANVAHAEDSTTIVGPQIPQDILDERNKALEESKTGCSVWGFNLDVCTKAVLAIIGNNVLKIFGFFTGIAGFMLDKAVDYTIVSMGANTEKIDVIEKGWKVFRDLSNIVIIFVLLFIGIVTILHSQDYNTKALLTKLIAVALLINFSLFFTQVVIDSSNLISLQFYNKITVTGQDSDGQPIIRKVGERYMDAFGLTTIYDGEKIIQPDRLSSANTYSQIFLTSILGSVMFLVASFAFLAGAFLLISRFVVLIFLMILAPLAFVGIALPGLKKQSGVWLSALVRYSLFAPAYMILTWFVIEVINSNAFRHTIGLDHGASFAKVVDGGNMAIIFNFIIVIAFIVASVLISNYFGIKGSGVVMKWGAAARKFGQGVVGRTTIGRPAGLARQGLAKAEESIRGSAPTGRVGRTLRAIGIGATKGAKKTAKGVEAMKFGSGVSRIDVKRGLVKEAVEDRKVSKEKEIKDSINKISGMVIPPVSTVIAGLDPKFVPELGPSQLRKTGVAQSLEESQLKALTNSGVLSFADKAHIKTQILANPASPGHTFMTTGPGSIFW